MADLTFKTHLSMEEIEANFEGTDLFSDLVEGLEESLAYAKGSPAPDTVIRKRSLPSVNVVSIRRSLNMTQKVFASILGVSPRTVEAWESGKSTPTPTAKILLHLIQEDNSLINRLNF